MLLCVCVSAQSQVSSWPFPQEGCNLAEINLLHLYAVGEPESFNPLVNLTANLWLEIAGDNVCGVEFPGERHGRLGNGARGEVQYCMRHSPRWPILLRIVGWINGVNHGLPHGFKLELCLSAGLVAVDINV